MSFRDLVYDVIVRPRLEAQAAAESKARKEADAKEKSEGDKRQADAETKAAASRAEVERLSKELKQCEAKARSRRLDEAARRIAEDRRVRGKRVLDPGELRSRAATQLAELDSLKQKLEGE